MKLIGALPAGLAGPVDPERGPPDRLSALFSAAFAGRVCSPGLESLLSAKVADGMSDAGGRTTPIASCSVRGSPTW